jgi:hypothetical protein
MTDSQSYPGSACVPRYDQPPPDWVQTPEQHLAWLNHEINGPEDLAAQEEDHAD